MQHQVLPQDIMSYLRLVLLHSIRALSLFISVVLDLDRTDNGQTTAYQLLMDPASHPCILAALQLHLIFSLKLSVRLEMEVGKYSMWVVLLHLFHLVTTCNCFSRTSVLLSSITVSQHLIFHLSFLFGLPIFYSFYQTMEIVSLWPLLLGQERQHE